MSESIFNLVQTLNKTEKSRFSEGLRQTKRINYYKKLLNIYGTAKIYSAELDIKVFKKANSKLINDCKAHFKDALNNFLISNKNYKSQQETIRKNFEIACMLIDRVLYSDALKLLKRTYRIAQNNGEMLYSLLISERVMFLERHNDITLHSINLMNMASRHKHHILEIEKYKEYRLEFHELWMNLGLYYKGQGFKEKHQISKDSLISNDFKIKYVKAEKKYYQSLHTDNLKKQHKQLSDLLNTVYENKNALKNPVYKLNYYYYLSAFIGLSISVRKFDKVDFAFEEFDSYVLESKRLYNDSFKYKLIASCKYFIFIGKPEKVEILDKEFQTRKISKQGFLATACYAELLLVNCVLGNYERCAEYISKLEKLNMSDYYFIVKDLVKIIVAIEKEDYVYAKSLITTYSYKSVAKDSLPFIKKFVQILKHRIKSNNKVPLILIDELLGIYNEFPDSFSFFIRYLEASTPISKTKTYHKFIKKNNFTKYKPKLV